MAGVTDVAFRQICSELGAGLTCTELISSKALCYHDKKTFSLLQQFPGEHPAAVQIFGSDPVCMAEAVQIAIEHTGADIVDLNMGWSHGKIGQRTGRRSADEGSGKGRADRRGGGAGGVRSGDCQIPQRLGYG